MRFCEIIESHFGFVDDDEFSLADVRPGHFSISNFMDDDEPQADR
jgi:hypothetical protein